MAQIHSVAIHPAIGIARVGNSPGGHFVGPEIPSLAALPDGGFKDTEGPRGRVKRQAARFRVFGYDVDGNPVGELTTSDARIEWTIEVANAKAEWDTFDGPAGEDLPIGQRRLGRFRRNRDIDGEARTELIIAPPAVTLEGPRRRATFEGGSFLGIAVGLGEARTDANGRLLVLAGAGRSGSSEQGRLVTHYANNDRWFDDVSDGPVRARVTLPDGQVLDAKPSWVICGPPDFAPEVTHPVTLYDVALDVAVRAGRLPEPDRPSFTHDIFPLLQRAPGLAWTSDVARRGHPQGAGWMDWSQLADAGESSGEARRAVFASMRDPTATGDEAIRQATGRYMPALAGDGGDPVAGDPSKWMSVTRTQHAALRRWAAGDFVSDWTGAPPPAGAVVTPAGLDRAALEACSGGPFYPGIEGGWLLRKPEAYMEPFRLNPAVLRAGDVTKQMAVPWQADFYECNTHWWPGQRPDEVLPFAAYERIAEIDAELANPRLGTDGSDGAVRADLGRERADLIARRVPWARGLPDGSPAGDNAMVEGWSTLGFVTSVSPGGEPFAIDGTSALIETERGAIAATLDLREAFHKLVNIETNADFRPTARDLAERFLSAADYAADPFYAPFEYSVEAFRSRVNAIYQAYVADMDKPHWLEVYSREAVVENLRQKAPMNLVDGAWLHHILSAGPADDVKAKLFSIWADEAGNGETELNHSNVYDGLLRSLDVYLPPIASRAFVELDLLPGAWENPVFQLAVGLFPQEFLPELLGMTLYLEWEATPTMLPIVRMLENHRIDPQFYRMHMAIDNVTAGHGALAREAIELYLDSARGTGGETVVQEQWRRIWRGYVAWATLGSLGKELGPLMDKIDRRGEHADGRAFARERMIALVLAKAPYARSAHGAKQLAGQSLGSLFADPDALLDALVTKGWVDPASPRDSRLVTELLGFHGPMYKVFSAPELDVLLDWIGSLADDGAPEPAPEPEPAGSADRVAAVIERHRANAAGEAGHARDSLPDAQGEERSVQEWFRSGNVPAIMAALALSRFVTLGDPGASSLIGEVFGGRMAGVLDPSEVQAFREWIADRCPQPGAARAALSRAGAFRGLQSSQSGDDRREPSFSERRQLIGAGAVH